MGWIATKQIEIKDFYLKRAQATVSYLLSLGSEVFLYEFYSGKEAIW